MRKALTIAAILVAVAVVVGAVSLFSLYEASQQVPEFYREALSREPESQTDARDEFIAQVAALASDLNANGRWQRMFSAEQINAWLALDLAEVWAYRDLVYFFIWRDIKVRYKQTVIGAAWAIKGRGVGAGAIARRAVGATASPAGAAATPRIAITGDRRTAIFPRSLASVTIVQRRPRTTRRRRRRVNWKRRRAKQ